MKYAPIIGIGLPWAIFLSSFLLVLLLRPPFLYVTYSLTALGVLYLGFEARRLRNKPLPSQTLARTIIRIGFVLLTTATLLSLIYNWFVLANNAPAVNILALIIDSLWIWGTIVAFGGVLFARIRTPW